MAEWIVEIVDGNPHIKKMIPLVRCKDCKYAHLTYDGQAKYCDQWETDEALYLDGDFYCAFGEKKVTE